MWKKWKRKERKKRKERETKGDRGTIVIERNYDIRGVSLTLLVYMHLHQ